MRPWALLNSIQTRGPLERQDCTSMAMPISEAAIGISHTSGNRRLRTLSGSGSDIEVAGLSSVMPHRLPPSEPWVETHCRQHGKYDYGAEKHDSRAGLR